MWKRLLTWWSHPRVKPLGEYAGLALLVVLAAVLRFYKLGAWSFWVDEVTTVRDVFSRIPLEYPITYLLIRIPLSAIGISEWSARLVPALVGIISIPLLYFPIRRMLGSVVALVSVFLLAISPWHLYWSQNARFYSLVFLLYSLAGLLFYLGIEESRPKYLWISLLVFAAALLTHPTAMSLLVIIFLYLGIRQLLSKAHLIDARPANARMALLAFGIVGVLYIVFYLSARVLFAGSYYPPAGAQSSPLLPPGEPSNPLWIGLGAAYYIGISVICVGTMAMVFLLAQRNQVGLFLGLNALVPLLALMLVAVFTYTANRYAFVTLMSWLTLTSAAVVELVRQSKGIMKILAVGVLLVLLAEPVGENLMYYKYQNGNRDDWRGAAQVVQQRYQPGDIVVGTENSVVAAYYLGPEVRVRWLSNQNVEALAKSATRVWFLLDMTTFAYDPRLVNWIYANTELVANLDVHYRARNFEMRVRLFDPARCRQ